MTVHTRRILRTGVTLAGLAALGTSLATGTALADEQPNGQRGLYGLDLDNGTDDDHDAPDAPDQDEDGSLGSLTSLESLDGDFFDFEMPSRGPSTSVPADDDTPSLPGLPGGHHDHHGADDPYDYDLYQPAEHYDENECDDDGASRHPLGATQNGLAGYNGDSSDDCDYDEDDYDPERTGFQRDPDDDYGYNGYTGTDSSRDHQAYTTVRGAKHMSEDDDDYDYEFDEDNATRDPD